MSKTVRETFLKVLEGKVKPQKEGETPEKFRGRVIKGGTKFFADNEKAWDKLDESAQNWFNDGVKSMKAEKDVPEFPDEKKAEPEAKAGKKGKKGKAEKKAKAPKAPRDSSIHKVRLILAKNPNWSKDQLAEACTKEGITVADATMQTVYHHGHAMLLCLREIGSYKF